MAVAACDADSSSMVALDAATDGGTDAAHAADGATAIEASAEADTPAEHAADVPQQAPDAAGENDAPAVCNVQAPTVCPTPAPRYAEVTPIVAQRCRICHDGRSMGPWPLVEYSHVADWASVIRDDLLNCTMPPANATPLPDSERQLLLVWIRCGSPR